MRNFRLAFRTLARTPFVSLVAVLSLALRLGANSAIDFAGYCQTKEPSLEPGGVGKALGKLGFDLFTNLRKKDGDKSVFAVRDESACAHRDQPFFGSLKGRRS